MSAVSSKSSPFTAILSTAGSRKTTQLTQLAVGHVLAGRANPEQILLTTLTRSAAAQLHERSTDQFLTQIRAAGAGSARYLDLCHRLEHAAIGTLHSLGLELLQRTAIVSGRPVAPRVLDSATSKNLLLSLLDQLDGGLAGQLNEQARRLGRHEPLPRKQTGVAYHDDLLAVIDLKRHLPRSLKGAAKDFVNDCVAASGQLAKTLKPTHPISTSATEPLTHYLQLAESHRGREVTDEQVDKIRRRGFWGAFREFQKTKNVGLQQRGQHLHSAHWLHEDSVAYVKTLAEVAQVILVAYHQEKYRRGLVDYHDLVVMLHRHGWPDELGFVGCDEVQDLTARQIETAERLVVNTRHPSTTAVWVGDEHQHLFAYQGASWHAARAAIDRLGGAVTPVHANHRSSPLLVTLFNELFSPSRPTQTAGRGLKAGEVTHVERWTLSTRDPDDDQHDTQIRNKLTMSDETRALAAGITDLLARRPDLRPSDIAISCRTNQYADHLIRALHDHGIPVDASPRSLAETREGRIVVEALRLLADPSDSLAAAVIRHLLQDWALPQNPTDWFWDALRDGGPGGAHIELPGLSALVSDRGLASRLSPCEAVERVIAAIGLVGRVSEWGSVAGRLRNLDGLVAVARGYDARCQAEQRPPTIAGLAAVFDDDSQPDESSQHTRVATGGVTVTTTHSAKGLGWPVAIVAECGWQPASGSSTFVIRPYEHITPKGRVRQQAHVLPWVFGTHFFSPGEGRWFRHHVLPEGAKRADLHQGPYGTAAAALPGAQALAASDRVAEENNVFVACTRAESILVFAATPRRDRIDPADPKRKRRQAVPTRLDFLQPALDRLLPPNTPVNTPREIRDISSPGSLDYTRFDYSWKPVVAADPPASAAVSAASVAATIASFRALQHSDPYPLEYPPSDGSKTAPDGEYPKRFWNPSDEPASHNRGIDSSKYTVVPLAGKPLSPTAAARITRGNDNLVGDAIHALFAALPSLEKLTGSARDGCLHDIAVRCITANGWQLPLDPDDLTGRVRAFESWLASESLDQITELSLVVPRTSCPATFWRGRIDAVGIPKAGAPAGSGTFIIDHKTAQAVSPKWLPVWLAEASVYAECSPHSVDTRAIAVHTPFATTIPLFTARR